jgi:glycosyltransferase involved in cell wall biosynthesis
VSLFKSLDLGSLFLFADLSRLNDALHPSKGLALAWELRKLGVSYMHIYGSTYPTTRGLVASYLLGIPFSISTFVDFDYDYAFKMFRQKVEHARFVVACTRFCAGRIRSYTSEQTYKKVHVIYNGIDCSRAEPLVGVGRSAKARLPCIIAIGRLVEKKGFDYLVKACALLTSRGLSPKCVIVGEGVERERLLSLVRLLQVEGEVELLGAISDEQLASYMLPENILVAPSVYAKDGERDGIPTVLFEAMFRGLPVISTTVSGIPELVVDGENGILVAERDEHALADALERLLLDAGLRERLRRRAHQKVTQDFCLEKSAHTLWSLIKSNAGETS